jgi:hypothetical protein
VKGNAPEFSIGEMTISNDDNNNGRLDPGENALFSFSVENSGHADANQVLSVLTGDSPYLNILNNFQIELIEANASHIFEFDVQATDNVPEGTVVNLGFSAEQGNYQSSTMAQAVIGQSPQIIVGNGTTQSSYYPFYTYYENNKTQILYRGSELGSGNLNIQEIAFNFSNIDDEITELSNLQIKFKTTTSTSLGSAYFDMTGATTVLNSSSFTMPNVTGWFNFDINDFIFDCTQNLVIEIVWGDNGNYGAYQDEYKVYSSSTSFTSVVYGYADSETPPNYDGNSTSRPNTTFFIEGEPVGDSYSVSFSVKNANSQPINNAVVMVGTLEQLVDGSGATTFDLLADDYMYSVYADGYAPIVNVPFTVDGDEQLNVIMYISSLDQLYQDIKVYPNPSSGLFSIDFGASDYHDAIIEITDINGKILYVSKAVSARENIDLGGLQRGLYFIRINSQGMIYTTKFIIK